MSEKYRCTLCSKELSREELTRGAFLVTPEGRFYCARCAPAAAPATRRGALAVGVALAASLGATGLSLWGVFGGHPTARDSSGTERVSTDAPRPGLPEATGASAADLAAAFEDLLGRDREASEARERDLARRLDAAEAKIREFEPKALEPKALEPAAALAELEERVLRELDRKLEDFRAELAAATDAGGDTAVRGASVGSVGDPAIDGWIADLFSSDATRRVTAVMSLFEAKDSRSIPHLERALASDDELVRSVAVRTLGDLDSLGSLPGIQALASGDPSPMVRLAALEAAARIDLASSIPVFISALSDPIERNRARALEALVPSSGQDFGFDPAADESSRLEAVERWIEWDRSRR